MFHTDGLPESATGASKLAEELEVTVKIVNGKDLDNLGNALDNKPFVGTLIHN